MDELAKKLLEISPELAAETIAWGKEAAMLGMLICGGLFMIALLIAVTIYFRWKSSGKDMTELQGVTFGLSIVLMFITTLFFSLDAWTLYKIDKAPNTYVVKTLFGSR